MMWNGDEGKACWAESHGREGTARATWHSIGSSDGEGAENLLHAVVFHHGIFCSLLLVQSHALPGDKHVFPLLAVRLCS